VVLAAAAAKSVVFFNARVTHFTSLCQQALACQDCQDCQDCRVCEPW
jgi:hypothetical protein